MIAALAALLTLAATPSALAHGGGGGGGYIVVYVPSGPPPPAFQGEEAAMALEVTDAPPSLTEGAAQIGDVIAVQPVRAADAIVTTAPIQGRHRTVPAGTVLVRARFLDPAEHAVVWCDIRPASWPTLASHDCFEDSHNSGQLDQTRPGDFVRGGFLGFGMSGIGAAEAMPAPIGYRPARPEERPAAYLAYKYCDGDDVVSPARFRLVAGDSPDPTTWRQQGDCRAGVWSDPADKSKVDVDGLHLIVTPAGDRTIQFRVVDRLPPGPLGLLVRYRPLRSLADTDALAADAARAATLKGPALIPTGQVTIAPGQVDIGQAFVTAPVKHALTGHLLNRVRPTKGLFWPAGTMMDLGQAVFGVPFAGAPGDGIAWCVASQKDDGWQASCLEPITDSYMAMTASDQGYYWAAKMKPPLAPNSASLGGGGEGDPASNDPTVALGPIDEPAPLTASLKLASVHPRSRNDPDLVYDLDVDLDWGEGPQRLHRVSFGLPPDGQAIRVMGQVLLLQPGGDDTHIAVSAPPTTPRPPLDVELLPTHWPSD